MTKTKRIATIGVYIEDLSVDEGDVIVRLKIEREAEVGTAASPAPTSPPAEARKSDASKLIESLGEKELDVLAYLATAFRAAARLG